MKVGHEGDHEKKTSKTHTYDTEHGDSRNPFILSSTHYRTELLVLGVKIVWTFLLYFGKTYSLIMGTLQLNAMTTERMKVTNKW